MKVGPQGKKRLREQIDFNLDGGLASGVPMEGIKATLTQWVQGLLENIEDNETLRRELEE